MSTVQLLLKEAWNRCIQSGPIAMNINRPNRGLLGSKLHRLGKPKEIDIEFILSAPRAHQFELVLLEKSVRT